MILYLSSDCEPNLSNKITKQFSVIKIFCYFYVEYNVFFFINEFERRSLGLEEA